MSVIFAVPSYMTQGEHMFSNRTIAFNRGKAVAASVQLERFLTKDAEFIFEFNAPVTPLPDPFWGGLTHRAVEKFGVGILNNFVFQDIKTREKDPRQYGFTKFKKQVLSDSTFAV